MLNRSTGVSLLVASVMTLLSLYYCTEHFSATGLSHKENSILSSRILLVAQMAQQQNETDILAAALESSHKEDSILSSRIQQLIAQMAQQQNETDILAAALESSHKEDSILSSRIQELIAENHHQEAQMAQQQNETDILAATTQLAAATTAALESSHKENSILSSRIQQLIAENHHQEAQRAQQQNETDILAATTQLAAATTAALESLLSKHWLILRPTVRTLFIAHNIKTRAYVDAWTAPFMQQPGWRIHVGTAKATDPKTHYVAESVSFFRFLQSNYDDIKKGLFGAHIVLLSDKGRDWHSPDDWSTLIETATPRCRSPLGKILIIGQNPHGNLKYEIPEGIKGNHSGLESEIPPIVRMLNVLNLTYDPEANDEYCCTESVISREAILLYTKDQYKFAKEMILRDPRWKWGYALERLISNMFNKC